MVWTAEIIEGQPPRCPAMTGLRGDQVAELASVVFGLLDGVSQPVRGRRRVLGLYRAVVLTLFLMRRNESQAVAGELFGCSQSTVFRIVCRLRPLLRAATAEGAGQVRLQAKRSAVLVDGFLAPTDNRTGVSDLFSGKRHTCGLNIQAVSDLAGRLVDTGLPVPGARHDSKALAESGIADRWASHLEPGGPRHARRPRLPGHRRDHRHPQTPRGRPDRRPTRLQHRHQQRPRGGAIAHLVNWKVLDTGWRGRLTDFPEVLHTVTGLEIYRTWAFPTTSLSPHPTPMWRGAC
ncbi:transposase family protein [Micromonospora sp. NPDC005173]|uniref:transposase family protein n=1 Tax=Micromonospora sp. NPDC005173 TaxID=3157165 RepID=UPI0033AEBEF0